MRKVKFYLFEMLKFLVYHINRDVTEPGMQSFAVMRGMGFLRGRLGNTGFRRQYVSDGKGGYSRQTVAFTMPETNSSNTVRQQNQRSKFRQLAILGGLLNRNGILRKFYYSGLGISGYNAFIRDNITREAAIKCDDGNTYIDWPKLLIAIGLQRKIVPYKSALVAGTDYDDSCKEAINLRWSNKGINKANRKDWSLVLVGIPINEQGTAEEICFLQPGSTMGDCAADVLLDKCDCCKTYWFAFFINTYTGENTTSIYLGADASSFDNLPDYDETTCCFNCEEDDTDVVCVLPSDDPEFCGCGHEGEKVDTKEIVFTGKNNYVTSGRSDVDILDPGVNDGSGVELSEEDPTTAQYTIAGIACPVDFTRAEFDLTAMGGNADEQFSDGDEMSARVTALLQDGTWAYDASDCTINSQDTYNTGGTINGNLRPQDPTVDLSDYEVTAEYGEGAGRFSLLANDVSGGEASVTTEITIGATLNPVTFDETIFELGNPNVNIDVSQTDNVITVVTTETGGFTVGTLWHLDYGNVDGSGTWTIEIIDPSTDLVPGNNTASITA